MFSALSLNYYYIVDSRFNATPSETWKKITYTYRFSLQKSIPANTLQIFFETGELYIATDNLNRTDLYDSTLVVMLPGEKSNNCHSATLKISANGISKEVQIRSKPEASCFTLNLCEILGATLTKDTEFSVSLIGFVGDENYVYFRYNNEIKQTSSSKIRAGGGVFTFKISQITQRNVGAFYNDTITYYYITSAGEQISETYKLTHQE